MDREVERGPRLARLWTARSGQDPALSPHLLQRHGGRRARDFGVIEGTRPGQALTIELSAGSAELPLKGEVSLDDATGTMFAEANELKVKPVLDVLRASGPLTVNLGLTNKSLPDQGRADAVEKFSQACELD